MASKKETIITKKAPAKATKKVAPKKIEKDEEEMEETEERDEETESDEDSSSDEAAPKGKAKKGSSDGDAADILPEVEDKLEDDHHVTPGFEEEDAEDMTGLDEEDLNPFGDKWEE
jgi:hypothetical protein